MLEDQRQFQLIISQTIRKPVMYVEKVKPVYKVFIC